MSSQPRNTEPEGGGKNEPSPAAPERPLPSSIPLRFLAPALGLIALIVVVGLSVYRHEVTEDRENTEHELASVGRLEVEQITSWLSERRGDAAIAREHPFVRRLVANPTDAAARADAARFFETLRLEYGYAEVALFDARARPLVVTPPGALHSCAQAHAKEALRGKTIRFVDLHRTENDGPIRLVLTAPVDADDPAGPVAGVVMLTIDPEGFLYPFLASWPVPSETAESVLIRREGEEMLYLSPLRFRKDAALRMRIPISRVEVPAVRAAVLGERGLGEGMDYRDASVLTLAREIPGTPWVLVSKVDTSEVMKPARDVGLAISGLAALAALCALLGTVAVWRQHTFRLAAKAMRRQAAVEADLRRSEALARKTLVQRRRSDEMLHTVFERSAIGIEVLDREGVLLRCNPRITEMFRTDASSIVGKFNLKTDPNYQYPAVWESLARGEPYRHVVELDFEKVEYGSERHGTAYLDVTVSPISDEAPSGIGFIVQIIDITERRVAELALQSSEAHLSEALRLAKAGHWEYDVATDRFTFNDNFYRVFRTNAEAVGGYTLSSSEYARRFCHPDDAALVGREVAAVLANTDPTYERHLDHRILFPDGTVGYVAVKIIAVKDAQNRTIHTRGVNQDITERRAAEQEVLQLATAVEQSAEMVLIADTESRIQYVNPAFVRISGHSRQELLGRMTSDLWRDDLEQETRDRIRQAIAVGDVWQGHLVHRRKDGSRYDEEATISPVRDAKGRITNVVVVSHDITVRLEMERHLREAQKLDGIGRLAGGVAHDFNNILAAMIMQLGVLFEEHELAPEVAEGLHEVEGFAHRAAALTRQLLLFSRRSVMQQIRLDLNEVLTNLLKMLLRILGEDVAVEKQLSPDLPLVEADPGMMEQVIMNLSINARDAMKGGGRLRFCTRVATFSAEDPSSTPRRRLGTFVCLEVSDTGCGMDEGTMARIFEPFFTTKGVGRGTGLGLATVYGIVTQHAGWIEVESRVGVGTTFRVHLPAKEGERGQAEPSSGAPSIGRGHETILLVEDDAGVRRGLEKLLTHAGYQVIQASSGPDAVAIWEARSGRIDLLFTDMVMPHGMSGLDLARRLRAGRPDLPVIVSSGYSADLVTQGDLGALGIVFVRKPSSLGEVTAAVRKCLDRQPLSRTGLPADSAPR